MDLVGVAHKKGVQYMRGVKIDEAGVITIRRKKDLQFEEVRQEYNVYTCTICTHVNTYVQCTCTCIYYICIHIIMYMYILYFLI